MKVEFHQDIHDETGSGDDPASAETSNRKTLRRYADWPVVPRVGEHVVLHAHHEHAALIGTVERIAYVANIFNNGLDRPVVQLASRLREPKDPA